MSQVVLGLIVDVLLDKIDPIDIIYIFVAFPRLLRPHRQIVKQSESFKFVRSLLSACGELHAECQSSSFYSSLEIRKSGIERTLNNSWITIHRYPPTIDNEGVYEAVFLLADNSKSSIKSTSKLEVVREIVDEIIKISFHNLRLAHRTIGLVFVGGALQYQAKAHWCSL